MNKKYYLGVDTSCYTTSMAVIDSNNKIILNLRKILEVKKGNKGLRQSEAFFQHIGNLNALYKEVSQKIDVRQIRGISVSSKPRNIENSYMPVFLSGMYFAENTAISLGVKIYYFSHQEGHIMSTISSLDTEFNYKNKFYSLHLSGGTTELLEVKYENGRFFSEIIGGTLDITAGQLIDRIGVKMGMTFPCGKEFDELSEKSESNKLYPISVKGLYMNLSGLESHGYKNIDDISNEDNAKSVLSSLSKSFYLVLDKLNKNKKILMTGGVSSNSYMRRYLNEKLTNVYFGEKVLSTDNAVGIAMLGKLGDI